MEALVATGKRFHIVSLGCAKNTVDSEAMEQLLLAAGHRRADGPAEADLLIGQHLQCLPIESLPLAQCAGTVLRENIYAERDQPPFDRVAMDGVALDSQTVGAATRSVRIATRAPPPENPPCNAAIAPSTCA